MQATIKYLTLLHIIESQVWEPRRTSTYHTEQIWHIFLQRYFSATPPASEEVSA